MDRATRVPRVIRCASFFQAKCRYCRAVPPIAGDTSTTPRGHILAMQRGAAGQSYIIAGPPHTLIEAMELAARLSGVSAPRLRAPASLLKLMSNLMRPVDALVTLPESYTPEYLRIVAGATYIGSNAKAKRELGLEMRSLEAGLPETLEHEMRQLGMTPRSRV